MNRIQKPLSLPNRRPAVEHAGLFSALWRHLPSPQQREIVMTLAGMVRKQFNRQSQEEAHE